MTKDSALRMALEALEMVKANADDWQERTGKEIKGWMQPVNNSITAIKEALQSNEQVEPVAWMRDDEMKAMVSDEKRAWILCGRSELIEDYTIPLFTHPPVPMAQPKPMTDEQIEAQKADWFHAELNLKPETIFRRGIRAAEAFHGIKENT